MNLRMEVFALIRKRKPQEDDPKIFQMVKNELLPFARHSFPSLAFTLDDLRKRLEPGETHVEIGTDGKPVGFIHFFVSKQDLWVSMLAVTRQKQGKGTGTRLMDRALRFAAIHNCSRCLLYVDENNEQAKLFYGKLGFRPDHYAPHLKCYLYSRACPWKSSVQYSI